MALSPSAAANRRFGFQIKPEITPPPIPTNPGTAPRIAAANAVSVLATKDTLGLSANFCSFDQLEAVKCGKPGVKTHIRWWLNSASDAGTPCSSRTRLEP
jgi:hypothetical protein